MSEKERPLGDPVGLATQAETLGDVEAVRARLRASTGPGWLQTTSAVWVRPSRGEAWRYVSGAVADEPWSAPPLDAEIAEDEVTCVVLRHLGSNWCWASLKEVPGSDHRVFDAALVSNWRPNDSGSRDLRLSYRVYWHTVTEGDDGGADRMADLIPVWRPRVGRFAGFVEE